MSKKSLVLAALGCTGAISEVFIDGFVNEGVNIRLLARDPKPVSVRFPGSDVISGTMMNGKDTARVMEGADAAFLVTPMGLRNDSSIESQAVAAAIEGARATGLKHLILVSAIGIDQPTGVPLLDAKHDAERLLAGSGVPWTSLRCGSYMEDVFDTQLAAIRKGFFPFPVAKNRRFTYTSQVDVPRFVAQELLAASRVMNGPINFVAPGTYTPVDLEKLLSQACGRPVRSAGKYPLYGILWLLQPYFNWRGHRFSTIVPLLGYFNKCGFTSDGETVSDLFPGFRMTTLEEHIQKLCS